MNPRQLVVFGACLTQFMVIGLLSSFGLFFAVLEEQFGWSRALLSGSTSLAFLTMGIVAFFGGRLNDRYGPTVVLGAAGVLFGIGYALIPQVDEPWQLLVLFAIFIGAGLGTHDVVTLSVIARWFESRRGIMTGVAKAGAACGQMLLPPTVALLVIRVDWRDAVLIVGSGAAALLLVAALSMRRAPDDPAPAPDADVHLRDRDRPPARHDDDPAPARDPGVHGPEFAEARRSRTFWTLCATQFLFLPSVASVPLHIVAHGADLGMSVPASAALLTVIGAASIVGRLSVGAAVDRIGGKNTYVLCFVPLLMSLLALVAVDTHRPLFAIVAAYGFAHGGFFTVVSPTVAEFFGTRAHGAIFGGVLFYGTIGAVGGPIMSGWIFDAAGSYTYAFTGLAVMAALGLSLVLSLPGPRSAPRDSLSGRPAQAPGG